MFKTPDVKSNRNTRRTLLMHVHVTACALALGGLAAPALAELWISYPGFSGVWGTAPSQTTPAKLWVREAADQSLTIGGFDERSTFSATCVLRDAARAICHGSGLMTNGVEGGQQAPHRFLYTSELSLDADTLKETWEVRAMLTPEEAKKVSKVDANLLKGVFEYQKDREPSRSAR